MKPPAGTKLVSDSPTEIRIGTSGYAFLDWVGPFYPPGLRESDRLTYYTRFFPVSELNVTFYRLPRLATLRSIADRTPPGFQFFIKAHQDITHHRENAGSMFKPFRGSLKPFRDSRKLAGVLAQFPYSFKLKSDNVDHLLRIRSEIPDTPLAVEFRHDRCIHDETFDFLRENEMTYTIVDEPDLPNLVPPVVRTTSDLAYLRFHGRNARDWYSGSGIDRYNYDYSEAELDRWCQEVESLLDTVRVIYILFNNCHLGRAPVNAIRMQEKLLGGPSEGGSGELFEPVAPM